MPDPERVEFRAKAMAGLLASDSLQQLPPARTLKNASISASVPTSPSALKSAVELHGVAGQFPARHAKKASISASVPTSPSQLKSALPQPGITSVKTPEVPLVKLSENTSTP